MRLGSLALEAFLLCGAGQEGLVRVTAQHAIERKLPRVLRAQFKEQAGAVGGLGVHGVY